MTEIRLVVQEVAAMVLLRILVCHVSRQKWVVFRWSRRDRLHELVGAPCHWRQSFGRKLQLAWLLVHAVNGALLGFVRQPSTVNGCVAPLISCHDDSEEGLSRRQKKLLCFNPIGARLSHYLLLSCGHDMAIITCFSCSTIIQTEILKYRDGDFGTMWDKR